MGKINNYLLHFPSFIFTENKGDDISETLNLNIFWWSMHPEPLDLERLPSLNFSSCAYVYIFKISHNALYYRYLIANEIIAKGRRKKKKGLSQNLVKNGLGRGCILTIVIASCQGSTIFI